MIINTTNYENYFAITEKIIDANNQESLLNLLQDITLFLGFDRYLIEIEINDPGGKSIHHSIGNYTNKRYQINSENNYTKDDAVITHLNESTVPFDWNKKTNNNSHCMDVQESAAIYRINNGVSASARGRHGIKSMISLSSSQTNRYTLNEIDALKSIVKALIHCTHFAIERIVIPTLVSPTSVNLTKQERESLTWVANGKTAWEIGKIMNISESTVVFHVKNVLGKLGAVNRQQAVALAIRSGIID